MRTTRAASGTFIASVGLILALTGAAVAGQAPDLSQFDLRVDFDGGTWLASSQPQSFTISERQNEQGKTIFMVEGAWSANSFDVEWSIEFDPDPFISNAFVQLANPMPSTQDFQITVIAPLAPPLAGPTVMTGSVSGFVGDGNGALDIFGNGATVETFGGLPYYEALVDGATVATLYDDPQTHTAGLNLTSDIDMMSFVGVPGPAANFTFGIRNNFRLTAGDNAGFTSTFLIVPAPGATGLLVLAGAMAMRRRR